VLGASADKIELNQQFTDKNSYEFPLLSDPDLKLIQALGIQSPKGKLAQRVTFVVDAEGKIAKIYDKVTPKDHPKEVLAFVKELSKK
jgi:thioredoxin-dependent peroxiredoxin